MRYIEDPAHTATDITFLLGYSQQSALTRAFRRWTGMSPSQYRAQPILGLDRKLTPAQRIGARVRQRPALRQLKTRTEAWPPHSLWRSCEAWPNPALYEEWISSVHRLKQVQRAAGIVSRSRS